MSTATKSGSRPYVLAGAAVCSALFAWQLYRLSSQVNQSGVTDEQSENSGEDVEVSKSAEEGKSREGAAETLESPIIVQRASRSGGDEKKNEEDASFTGPARRILAPNTITVTYATTTGTCESLAQALMEVLEKCNTNSKLVIQCHAINKIDWWDELLNDEGSKGIATQSSTKKPPRPPTVLFVLPTWSEGTFPDSATSLKLALEELATDWRIEPQFLKKSMLHFSVFAMGSTAYDVTTFCKPAKTLVSTLRNRLGGKFFGYLGKGDDSAGDFRVDFGAWRDKVVPLALGLVELKKSQKGQQEYKVQGLIKGVVRKVKGSKPVNSKIDAAPEEAGCCSNEKAEGGESCACKEDSGADTNDGGCCGSNTNAEEEKEVVDYDDDSLPSDTYDSDSSSANDSGDEYQLEPDVIDMEDMGGAMVQSMKEAAGGKREPKEMVTPKQAASLKKEGYKLIGTHSAVKLCRWTKHQLRGRGGCYKHTFYGITSYQCMEATPSLACANKCVFCWRHHKNPVGKEWRWKTDDPNFIVETAVQTHLQLIREARGIPGVVPARYQEALTVRHCALSLVGEPIMYPRINELLHDLHTREISTFLVTNGQHPKQIGTLIPITQLYVSVDAPTEKSLIEIDRPLFQDAWDRLRESLVTLKDKGQRTVARLTVVKGWNSNEIQGYANLIDLGKVSLVEIKGVTFCGKSDASNLNMSNSPWHHEVIALAQTIQQKLEEMTKAGGPNAPPLYGVACEHKHSCSVLLARVDQFAVEDPVTGKRKWRTWIDYPKYHELAMKHAADPTFTFSVMDYVADTPDWAMFGAEEAGFDPTDRRHHRNGKKPLYTEYDERGVPSHDRYGAPLSSELRAQLSQEMDVMLAEVGTGDLVTEEKGGEKRIANASNMFRGLTVGKEE
jgi:tRNA wybutosine-synthesizing protein 1